MARVTVRLYATMREVAGRAEIELEADDLAQVAAVLSSKFGKRLASALRGFPDDHERLVVLVNGRNVRGAGARALVLRDGDEVSIFPPVSGG